MIEAVLFDLDSTLMDFIKMKRIASEQAASAIFLLGFLCRFVDPLLGGHLA